LRFGDYRIDRSDDVTTRHAAALVALHTEPGNDHAHLDPAFRHYSKTARFSTP
jgi:hypothetical protein